MNMVNKVCSAVMLLSSSLVVSASGYFPHRDSDISHFENSHLQQSSIEVVATSGANWKKYSTFLEQENQWVWSSDYSNRIYWLSSEGYAELLVDFDDPVGTQYRTNVDGCSDVVELTSKNKIVSTPAGQFNDVVQLSFRGYCRDSGLMTASFVQGVGLVKWRSLSIAGEVESFLTTAVIDNVSYPIIEGLQISSEIESGLFNLNQKRYASAYFNLENKSQSAVDITFNSGQKFDIEIVNEYGNVVNRWSHKRMFTEAIETLAIAAGESLKLGGYVELKTFDGFSLHNGNYHLRVILTGRENSWQGVANQSRYQMEVPFTVTYQDE